MRGRGREEGEVDPDGREKSRRFLRERWPELRRLQEGGLKNIPSQWRLQRQEPIKEREVAQAGRTGRGIAAAEPMEGRLGKPREDESSTIGPRLLPSLIPYNQE